MDQQQTPADETMTKLQVYSVYHVKVLNITRMMSDSSRTVSRKDYTRVAMLRATSLEAVFVRMNVVNGTELPARLGIRSLHCGDVVVDGDGVAHRCEPYGWKQVEFVE
jgi:hypothetical protein